MRENSQNVSANSKVFLATLSPRPIAFSTYGVGGPTVIIRLSQFNLTTFDCQLELSLTKTYNTLTKTLGLNEVCH